MSRRVARLVMVLVLTGGLVVPSPLVPTAPTAAAVPLPPGANAVVSILNFFGSVNSRNRIYREARTTKAEIDAYYDGLLDTARSQLLERDIIDLAKERNQFHAYERMRALIEQRRRTAVDMIEAEKNDARRRFNNEIGRIALTVLVRSPGGQQLIRDVKATLDGARQAALAVQAALGDAHPEELLATLAERVSDVGVVQNAVLALGSRAAAELDRRLNGIITRIGSASEQGEGDMTLAIEAINNLDATLDRELGLDRTPIVLAGEGSPLRNLLPVDRAEAAVSTGINALLTHGQLIGAFYNLSGARRANMYDRIRDQLLAQRLAAINVGRTKAAQHIVCDSSASHDAYLEATATLGIEAELPADVKPVFLVCTDPDTGLPVYAALIGPVKAATEDPTTTTTATTTTLPPTEMTGAFELAIGPAGSDAGNGATSTQHMALMLTNQKVSISAEALERGLTESWWSMWWDTSQNPFGLVVFDLDAGTIAGEIIEQWSCEGDCSRPSNRFQSSSWAATITNGTLTADGDGWKVTGSVNIEYQSSGAFDESPATCDGVECYSCPDGLCTSDRTGTGTATISGTMSGTSITLEFADGLQENIEEQDFSALLRTEFFMSRFSHTWSLTLPIATR
jgi:hypothetical protein